MPRFIVLLALVLTLQANGQDSSHHRYSYSAQAVIGMQQGNYGTGVQLQLINGIRMESGWAGIGVGLDNYMQRSVPVFLSLQKKWGRRQQAPFLYLNGGVVFPWVTNDQEIERNYRNGQPGIYFDGGLGYAFPLSRKKDLFFSAGYSYKRIYIKEAPPCASCALVEYEYGLNRLSVRMGVQL
jgi:hypothetical protein